MRFMQIFTRSEEKKLFPQKKILKVLLKPGEDVPRINFQRR